MLKKPVAQLCIIDDDAGIVAWLCEALQVAGYQVHGETSARQALAYLRTNPCDLLISDVEMPEMRGPALLQSMLKIRPEQLILLITAFGTIDSAVAALSQGAIDFLAKPFRLETLLQAIQRALATRHKRREIVRLRAAVQPLAPHGMVARSAVMQHSLAMACRAARSKLPILITGESGVGKTALAKFVHTHSPRRAQPFVQLNCAALPASLAEAELFGVRRGAFTDAHADRPGVFAQAHQGSLFLDEIGELPLSLQAKLLQALEAQHVRPLGATQDVPADVRIIAATNLSLETALQAQRFRADLYHRLNGIQLALPPLRQRPEDIDALVDATLHALSSSQAPTPVPLGISQEAMHWLRSYSWPGNVRELLHSLERAVALAEHDVLVLEDFQPASEPTRHATSLPHLLATALQQDLSLTQLKNTYIRHVLLKTRGHKAQAAKILGVDRRTLYRQAAVLEDPLPKPA